MSNIYVITFVKYNTKVRSFVGIAYSESAAWKLMYEHLGPTAEFRKGEQHTYCKEYIGVRNTLETGYYIVQICIDGSTTFL